jgi:hypothetical protein|tara:strand:+ start:2966 stop:3256 length:291 start_codon:yes stop_codon:yes gene_type:complete
VCLVEARLQPAKRVFRLANLQPGSVPAFDHQAVFGHRPARRSTKQKHEAQDQQCIERHRFLMAGSAAGIEPEALRKDVWYRRGPAGRPEPEAGHCM